MTLAANNAQSWNGDFTFNGTQNLNLGAGAVTWAAAALLGLNLVFQQFDHPQVFFRVALRAGDKGQ